MYMKLISELGQHFSGLIWAVMLVSAAIVITLPRESGVRTLVASTILRMIFSIGPEPTLLILGTLTVSNLYIHRPRGKESTKVRITQNKGKESENSFQKLKRSR